MDREERTQVRVHGSAAQPTLIYLPGLHGDWTLIASFRHAMRDRVRFVEFTYPRNTTWKLDDYARAVVSSLRDHDIDKGWILAESFSSLVAWAMLGLDDSTFRISGIILAGGFVRHPTTWLVPVAKFINRAMPIWAVRLFCVAYKCYARVRHRTAPETLRDVDEFITRRSDEGDRAAICSRYDLIRDSDFRSLAASASIPIYQLCGLIDPIVPWPWVRRWLKDECPSCRGWRLIWSADHNVLGSAPKISADQVWQWISSVPQYQVQT